MKTSFRKTMIWLHTYVGVFTGWLLFTVFFTGTLSYYNQEITHWMTFSQLPKASQTALINTALNTLYQQGADASQWRIQLPDERGRGFSVSYRLDNKRHTQYIDPQSLEQIQAPRTQGGNFFRTFHYSLSLGQWGGRYLSGIAAMAMLIGVFTGIYTHRRFFKDFFTLRTKHKVKFITDFHAMSGVITIPFCVVISVSALLIYINLYQPFAIEHYFDNYRNLDKEVSTRREPPKPSGESIKPLNDITHLEQLLIQQQGSDVVISSILINHPTDSHGQIIFTVHKHGLLSNKAQTTGFTYDGKPLDDVAPERFTRQVRRVFYGLHEAHFATPGLRAMLFLLGMFATILIATGMVIWLRSRQLRKDAKRDIWLNKVNNAVVYGLPLAVACYFLCSKIIVFSWSLSTIEIPVFFSVWLLSLLVTLVLSPPRGTKVLFLFNAVAYCAITFIDLFHLVFSDLQNITLPFVTLSSYTLFTLCYFANCTYQYWVRTSNTQANLCSV